MKNLKLKKKPKTQAKNSKLKQKTQVPGGTRLFPLPKGCLKKMPALVLPDFHSATQLQEITPDSFMIADDHVTEISEDSHGSV